MRSYAWPKPDPDRTPANWSRPAAPLLSAPAPRGHVPVSRGQSEAEDILSGATAWWDASRYRPGDRWLRNQGQGGPELDARLGSSLIPNTNDPLYLAPEDKGYCYLPGVAGSNLSVPDAANLRITGDFDVRVLVRLDSTAAGGCLISKWGAPQDAFSLRMSSGYPQLLWSVDGSAAIVKTCDAVLSSASYDGQLVWVRATLDVDNGASGNNVRFYTSPDGTTWTQLGSAITTAGVTSVYAGTAALLTGQDTTFQMAGQVYRAQVYAGLGGTDLRLDVDCDAITSGGQSGFLARTGQVVTINRATSGRKTVAMPNRERKKADDACVYLPGVIGNYIYTADAAPLRITGDLDVRMRIAPDSWTPAATSQLFSRRGAAGNIAWQLYLSTLGKLVLEWSADGTNTIASASTIAVSASSGSDLWVRATLDVDNGASGNDVRFYTAPDGTTWTQLGATVTTAGVTSIYAGTTALCMGARAADGQQPYAGRIYRAQVYSGINGSLVLDVDTGVANKGWQLLDKMSFPAITGQAINAVSTTTGAGMRVLPERWEAGRPVFLFGTDDYMEVQGDAQHRLLGLAGGQSATILWVGRRWPTLANGRLLSKWSGSGYGWVLTGTSTGYQWYMPSAGGMGNIQSASTAPGLVAVVATRNPVGRSAALAATISTTGADPSTDLSNAEQLRFGRDTSAGTTYLDGELTAAAIFRRTLTPREIDLIARYYGTVWS